MKFTHSCFIRRNTPDLRKKLEELGYKKQPMLLNSEPYIHTMIGNPPCYSSWTDVAVKYCKWQDA